MLGYPLSREIAPGIHIDAEIGRQMRQADDLIPAMKTQNRIDGGIIIIGLGTNGAFSKQDLDSLLRPLDSAKQILLINTRVPRDWEQNVNGMLAKRRPEPESYAGGLVFSQQGSSGILPV